MSIFVLECPDCQWSASAWRTIEISEKWEAHRAEVHGELSAAGTPATPAR